MSLAPSVFISNCTVHYHHHCLFSDLNLTLKAGKVTCLLGPSGIGKTTLLRLIAGLTSPGCTTTGNIFTNNPIPVAEQSAYMAQQDLLLPWANVLHNATLGARLRHELTREKLSQAEILLAKVGLAQHSHKYPRQLSGGMRQRVALVRTLMENKPLLLLDEPFSALDAITRFDLQTLAAKLMQDRTVLLITHDPLEALRLGHEIYILSGTPAKLSLAISLYCATPRDPSSIDFIHHQATLYKALTASDQQEPV